jgi:hypothetical protein
MGAKGALGRDFAPMGHLAISGHSLVVTTGEREGHNTNELRPGAMRGMKLPNPQCQWCCIKKPYLAHQSQGYIPTTEGAWDKASTMNASG